MNRFKKELIKRGFSLEHQYPCLPYEVSNGIYIDSIIANAEYCTYTTYYNVLRSHGYFDRSMNYHEFPDNLPKFN